MIPIDIDREINATHRHTGTRPSRDGAGEERLVTLRRTYAAPIEDVWDACTDAERVARWFLPVRGDLRVGGVYQLEGNAGGEILRCEPPRLLRVSWVFGERRRRLSRSACHPAARGRPSSSWSTGEPWTPRCGRSSGRARSASAGTSPCSG